MIRTREAGRTHLVAHEYPSRPVATRVVDVRELVCAIPHRSSHPPTDPLIPPPLPHSSRARKQLGNQKTSIDAPSFWRIFPSSLTTGRVATATIGVAVPCLRWPRPWHLRDAAVQYRMRPVERSTPALIRHRASFPHTFGLFFSDALLLRRRPRRFSPRL